VDRNLKTCRRKEERREGATASKPSTRLVSVRSNQSTMRASNQKRTERDPQFYSAIAPLFLSCFNTSRLFSPFCSWFPFLKLSCVVIDSLSLSLSALLLVHATLPSLPPSLFCSSSLQLLVIVHGLLLLLVCKCVKRCVYMYCGGRQAGGQPKGRKKKTFVCVGVKEKLLSV